MNIFFISESVISVYKDNVKVCNKLDTNNNFLNNLKRLCSNCKTLTFIANNPEDYQENDISAKMVFDAFKAEHFDFTTLNILDDRTKPNATQIINNSDIIYLQGGVIPYQNSFIKDINLKSLVQNTNKTLIGKSAGAMNLCKNVYNYPETTQVTFLPKWYTGLDFVDINLIPHFDKDIGNVYVEKEVNVLQDHYLPDSVNFNLLGLYNGSYILLENNNCFLYGLAYSIKNQKITKICENNQKIKLF